MAWSEYTCVRKRCLSLRHSGRDAFSEAVIFLPRFVTRYYNLTLKITASVLHGLRKRVRESIDGVRTSVSYSIYLVSQEIVAALKSERAALGSRYIEVRRLVSLQKAHYPDV